MKHTCTLIIAAGLGSVACGGQGGKLASTGTGDLTHALSDSERIAPNAQQTDLCGDGALTDEGEASVSRPPYLQQVGSSDAKVVLKTGELEAVKLAVTLPDGTPVAAAPAERDSSASLGGGQQWVASVGELAPGTLHCYEVEGLSSKTGFVTAPEPGSSAPARFIAFGDSGTGNDLQHAVADQMLTVPFDFIVHTGDVAYEMGKMNELESYFFGVYPELLRSFPAFAALGNHDYQTAQGAPFLEAFVLPENGGSANAERWYSFDWGDVHFVALDTERIGAEQAEWLEQDLLETELPWKVVFAHEPPYSSGEHGSSRPFEQTFVPVLQRHGVQLVITGHDHDYERTKPLEGVTYIVTGGGGRGTRPVGTSSFTAYSEDVLHFVYVEVEGRKLMVHAIDGVGREFDSTEITI